MGETAGRPQSRCPKHPDREALTACARCGAFVCDLDLTVLDGQPYCGACAARDDVDWLGAWERKYTGRRDGWSWLFGLLALANLGVAAVLVAGADRAQGWAIALAGTAAVNVVTCALWFLRRPIARRLIFAGPGLLLLSALATGEVAAGVYAGSCCLVALSAVRDVRSRLSFRLAIPREDLLRHYHRAVDNVVAQLAVRTAVLGLVFPFVGVVALGLGLVGLARVDPLGTPPVGKRLEAIAAIVVGGAEVAFVVFLSARFLNAPVP